MFDISLLYELKKGNREAFNGVFRYYYPRMMAYVASMVEQKVAEDIVQDVSCMCGKTVKSYMSVMVSIPIFFNLLILVAWTISRKTSRLKNTILILTRNIWKISESVERRQSCY